MGNINSEIYISFSYRVYVKYSLVVISTKTLHPFHERYSPRAIEGHRLENDTKKNVFGVSYSQVSLLTLLKMSAILECEVKEILLKFTIEVSISCFECSLAEYSTRKEIRSDENRCMVE